MKQMVIVVACLQVIACYAGDEHLGLGRTAAPDVWQVGHNACKATPCAKTRKLLHEMFCRYIIQRRTCYDRSFNP